MSLTTDAAVGLSAAQGYRGAQQDAGLIDTHARVIGQLEMLTQAAARHEAEKQHIIEDLKTRANRIWQERFQRLLVGHSVRELGEYPLNVAPGTVRLLENANLHTLADLSKFRADWAYTVIRGIGEVKSKEIHDANQRLRQTLRRQVKLTFETPLKEGEVELLDVLQQLQLLLVAERSISKQRSTVAVAEDLQTRYESAQAPLTTRVPWFFPNSRRKVEARQAVVSLANTAAAMPIAVAEQQFMVFAGKLDAQRKESTEKTIADFEAEPAAFYSLLARYLRGTDGNALVDPTASATITDADKGNLHEALWNSIMAVELDLDGMSAILRPYQEFGVKFLAHQHHVILGDDPGLGKTMQTLALMVHRTNERFAQQGTRPVHLVVAPLSVQQNWVNEIAKHTNMRAHKLLSIRDEVPAGTDIIVGTYERTSAALSATITGVVAVDEAHFVKNANTARTQRVRALMANKRDVVLMTGTALENRLEELTQLASFVNPEVGVRLHGLGERAPIEKYRETLETVYLRRNKEDVLTELPAIVNSTEVIEMAPTERELYQGILMEQPHPWHALRQLGYKHPSFSKVQRVAEIIEEARQGGEKVLLFSFYLEPLSLLQRHFSHLPSVRVDGKVDPETRQGLVDQFNKHEGTMLYFSQINTGGVGLNLQAASRVIILEPQIKPSLVTQAVARAHRMGQRNTVQMHMMVSDDSLDERILSLQEEKEELFNDYARESEIGDRSAHLDDLSGRDQQRLLQAERSRYTK